MAFINLIQMEAVLIVFSGNRMEHVIMILGIISIIFGVIFWYQGYSQSCILEKYHRSVGVMETEKYYMIAVLLIIIGMILVIKSHKGKGEEEKVDWPKVAQRIKDVRNALDHVHRIKIQSKGDIAYAEPLGNARLTKGKNGAWVMSTPLDVNDFYARDHAKDFISIVYPYENQWVEVLDNNASIYVFRSSTDQNVILFLDLYISIPEKLSLKKIQRELKKYM